MKILMMILLTLWAACSVAQTFVELEVISHDGGCLLEAKLINPTAPTHTYEYVREHPNHAVWYSSFSTKWLPITNSRYYVIVRGITYTPPNNIVTHYVIRSNTVALLRQPSSNLIEETKQ